MLKVDQITSLADRIMFCAPPGTGDWVAAAGLNHWRAQFNDAWCRSMTATMHELGHTIGLVHANKNGVKYGDTTGIMSKSYRNFDGPLRCFDGSANHILGWYKDRELMFDPLADPSPRLINLAAFVDYPKTTAEQPVLITLSGEVFIQYNRAKDFHTGTGEMANMVTIAENGPGGSNLLAGIDAQQSYKLANYTATGRNLVVEVCRTVPGDNSTTADVMVVSVGMEYSACPELSTTEADKGKSFNWLWSLLTVLDGDGNGN